LVRRGNNKKYMQIPLNKKIYMLGIKGVGMSMLAQFLSEKEYDIVGSDTNEIFMTDEVLKNCGIKVYEGFSVDNLDRNIDVMIYSTAYNENTNIEFAEAKKRNIKMVSYAEALGVVFKDYFGIAVIGSHGKTTTTAWLGFLLKQSGLEPNVMVGAKVRQLGGCSITGASDYLVIEADEYQNKLKHFEPKAVLLNNIDYDHPDFFPNEDAYKQVFVDFINKIPKRGFLVANFDDPIIQKIARVNTRAKVISYGIKEAADIIAYDIKQSGDVQIFKAKFGVSDDDDNSSAKDKELGEFKIKLSGKHNIYNALAVIATAIELNISLVEIRTHLEEFTGTSRRMEILGKYNGAVILDDYAHHPTEIKATLEGAKKLYPNKNIITVFHPHTFTRTKGLLNEFSESFADTNELVVLDIYGSAREEHGGVHSKDLILKIEEKNPGLHIVYIPTLKECEEYLRNKLSSRDLLILMGAGDVFRVGENLVK
jgi:UDP-N-acetylmuramate--alanine ligase